MWGAAGTGSIPSVAWAEEIDGGIGGPACQGRERGNLTGEGAAARIVRTATPGSSTRLWSCVMGFLSVFFFGVDRDWFRLSVVCEFIHNLTFCLGLLFQKFAPASPVAIDAHSCRSHLAKVALASWLLPDPIGKAGATLPDLRKARGESP